MLVDGEIQNSGSSVVHGVFQSIGNGGKLLRGGAVWSGEVEFGDDVANGSLVFWSCSLVGGVGGVVEMQPLRPWSGACQPKWGLQTALKRVGPPLLFGSLTPKPNTKHHPIPGERHPILTRIQTSQWFWSFFPFRSWPVFVCIFFLSFLFSISANARHETALLGARLAPPASYSQSRLPQLHCVAANGLFLPVLLPDPDRCIHDITLVCSALVNNARPSVPLPQGLASSRGIWVTTRAGALCCLTLSLRVPRYPCLGRGLRRGPCRVQRCVVSPPTG